MAQIKYCLICKKEVKAKRKIGFLTILFALLTGGLTLPFILFYRRKCPSCGGTVLVKPFKRRAK